MWLAQDVMAQCIQHNKACLCVCNLCRNTVPAFRNPDQVSVLKKVGANKSRLGFQSFNLTPSLRPTGARFRDRLHLLANNM